MRLKTAETTIKDATSACQEALLRRGFKKHNGNLWRLRLGGDKPGEVYDVWLPSDGFRGDCFVEITKGTVIEPFSKNYGWVDWGLSNKIKLWLG